MTLKDEMKRLALGDDISPNFLIIGKYNKNCSEEVFYDNYLYYKRKGTFNLGTKVINKAKLGEYKSDLLYFLVEAFENFNKYSWAKEVSLAREDGKALEQAIELQDFILKVDTHGGYKRSRQSVGPSMKEIKFITDKQMQLTISSHRLCVDIINLIQKYFYENRDKLFSSLDGNTNLNPRQFDKKFILSLKPLIEYLEKATIKWKSKNDIYEFVCKFLDVLDIEIIPSKIKDALKPSRL